MERINLNEEVSWKKLKRLYDRYKDEFVLKDLFAKDAQRFTKYW